MHTVSHPLGEELQGFLNVTTAFNENVDRAFKLIHYATKSNFDGSSPGEIKSFIEDILRSCVVLAHSSLETALRDIFARRLKAKAETEAPKVPLVGLQRNEKFNWENLYRHRQKTVKQIVDESIDDYISRLSFNSTTDIANYLKELGVDLKYVTPLFADLEVMIQRRHQIVHEADYSRAPGEKKLETLTHITVFRWLDTAATFLLYCIFSILISESYVREINRKLRDAGSPEVTITEETIKKLFDLTPKNRKQKTTK